MYHKAQRWDEKSYYDTIEEMPQTAKVTFPNGEVKEMTAAEMFDLSSQGWYTIMHSCNYGSCDHWVAEPLAKWVNDRFNSYYRFTSNGKDDGNTIGFNRREWSVRLTRNKHYFHSEVWNS